MKHEKDKNTITWTLPEEEIYTFSKKTFVFDKKLFQKEVNQFIDSVLEYEKKGIYFDFKYYSQKSLNYSTKNIIDRSKYKLEINRLNKAVIVNIFAEAEIKAEISVLSHENVVVLPC